MTPQIVRRVYIYAAAFLGLQLLAGGARGMLDSILKLVALPPALGSGDDRTLEISLSAALMIVGAPLWLLHWRWAQRSLDHADERGSALRRLYGYAVLLVAMLGLLFAGRSLLAALIAGDAFGPTASAAASALASLIVNGAVWLAHSEVFRADRAQVESAGTAATLRRWYQAIVLGVSLALGASGAVAALDWLLRLALAPPIGNSAEPAAALGSLISGLAVWLPHHLWARALIRQPSPLRDDEARSTLRQIYNALVITITLIAALGGLATLIYWLVLAILGGASWSSVATEHTQALAVVVVAGALWLYHRVQLADEAQRSDIAARVDTSRRVFGYLTAAVGLVALFFGLGGLLNTLLRLALLPTPLGSGWRDSLSFNLAMSLVALPVYGFTARSMEQLSRHSTSEERTLSRRIYLYAALLFGIVATIVALVETLQLVIGALLGAPRPELLPDLAGWIGYAAVGIGIGVAYTALLRRVGAARAAAAAAQSIAVIADEPLRSMLAAAIERELPGATVQPFPPDAVLARSAELAAADVVLAPLEVALDPASRDIVRAFAGRRLLLATPSAPPYEIVGALAPAAVVRAAVRALRADTDAGASAQPAPTTPRTA